MVDVERKTPEAIKQKILAALNDKPLNAQDISKAINSNWSTVKSYIVELVNDGNVREMAFGEKNVIYLKVTGDTYFNLPIKEKDREMLKFIFSNAIREYKEAYGKQIRRTDLAKLTHHVNHQLNLDLPIVWYIYGPMPLLIMNLEKDYSQDFAPENSEEIIKEIQNWIKLKKRDKVKEEIAECYTSYNNRLYQLKLKIYDELEGDKLEGLASLCRDFYLAYLSEFREKNLDIVERFYNIISGIDFLKKFDKVSKPKIILAFDSIWKFIAAETLFESLIKLGYEKEVAELYMNPVIETKIYLAEEALKELDEEYTEILPDRPIKLKENETSKKIAKVTEEWAQSESWRK